MTLRRAMMAWVVAMVVALAGCGSHLHPAPLPQAKPGKVPEIVTDAETGKQRTQISVLIYNVAGVPWPIRSGRHPAFRKMERDLTRLHNEGRGPDLMLLQEAFTPRSGRIGKNAGYVNWVRGPRAKDKINVDAPPLDADFIKGRRFWKGEKFGKIMSSGLYLYSVYPVTSLTMTPFGRRTCAGYDCLANKGVMMAVIEIPGVPEPIQVMNTHLNARKASGVGIKRTLYAYQQQINEIRLLLDRDLRTDWPFIYGGDFNTRRSNARFDHKVENIPGTVVDYYCAVIKNTCDVRLSWDGDEPWMDTQDLQGFEHGSKVHIRPVRLEAMFDEPYKGKPLSDHDGYLVTYELSWEMK